MSSEQFSLYWDNFHKNMSMGMQSLLETKDLVDVTLAVEGRYLKAHKMVLSVCSPYFRELFQSNPCKHPIVFMKDVSYVALNDLLHFMYLGEAQVAQENFSTFMQTAEALQITGLTGDGAAQMTCESGQQAEKITVETSGKRLNEVINQNTISTTQSIPASKRQKCSNVPTTPQTPSPVPSTVKYEFTSDSLQSVADLDIKVEHDDNIQETEEHDGNQEESINEAVLFKMNEEADFLLMESGSDDPRPTTSTDAGDDQDISVWNAFTLYRKNGGRKSHLQFHQTLFEELHSSIEKDEPSSQPDPLRLTERHFPEHIPPTEKKAAPCRYCAVCCSKRDEKGKKRRKESSYIVMNSSGENSFENLADDIPVVKRDETRFSVQETTTEPENTESKACTSTLPLDTGTLRFEFNVQDKILRSSLFDGTYFQVFAVKNYNIDTLCQLCLPTKKIIKGSLLSTTNFTKHMQRMHPTKIEEYKNYKKTKQRANRQR